MAMAPSGHMHPRMGGMGMPGMAMHDGGGRGEMEHPYRMQQQGGYGMVGGGRGGGGMGGMYQGELAMLRAATDGCRGLDALLDVWAEPRCMRAPRTGMMHCLSDQKSACWTPDLVCAVGGLCGGGGCRGLLHEPCMRQSASTQRRRQFSACGISS
jgi:hypothetical protein